MCIMQVHPGAQCATMFQAQAHNLHTWNGDAEMLIPILRKRREHDSASILHEAQGHVQIAMGLTLSEFAKFAGPEPHRHHPDVTEDSFHIPPGNERPAT